MRIRAASLNRRDQAIITGTYFGTPVARDTIPLSDGAGEVTSVGEGVVRFKPGDRVAAAFSQTPPGGPPFAARATLGSPHQSLRGRWERSLMDFSGSSPLCFVDEHSFR